MSNKFDTAELNDIRKLLGEDVPDPKSQVPRLRQRRRRRRAATPVAGARLIWMIF